MPKKRAKLIRPDGSFDRIPFKIAFQLLETTDYRMISRRPLVIRPFIPEHFQEERRFLSGRLVKGATRGKSGAKRRGSFNGQAYTSSSIRCRPPRMPISEEEREFRDYKREYLKRDGTEGERAAEEVMARRKAS